MKRTIGIIAPLIDKHQFHRDFNLRLSRNNRELTLAAFYELANESFKTEHVSRGFDYGDDIPAAGFYLEGLLHQYGYDTILTNKYDTDTIKTIAEQDPFAICVSTTMIITTDSLLGLFSSIRSAMPDTHIIAGGVFVWKNYLQFMKHLDSPHLYPHQPRMLFHPGHTRMDADILVVAPHGKSSLLEVLKELEKGSSASFEHIPNLCLPGDNGFNFTKREEEQVDYDEDYTRWDLIDEIPEKIPLRTSIGCPYRCRFCDFCQLYPRIFLRSRTSLSQELNLVKNRLGQNLAVIHVSDDNVFITKKRLYEVCDAITESGLRHWIGFMRGGEYSDNEMEAIERSGLMMGKIGVESGDPGQLERMNKRQKIENVKRGVEQLDAHGISVLMTFVVGFPGENKQTLRNTAAFLNNLSLTNLSAGYQLYPLVIFPLSELADPSARTEWKIEGLMEKWSHYTMKSEETFEASYDLFKEVTNVPYSYSEESYFFNRGMFTFGTRKSLFQLRQELTIKLIENAPWEYIEPILKRMAQYMELSVDRIGESLRHEISVPYIR
ncbi:MAG: radical SAM protein [Bacteroidales bacterium]|nr:radical SAM protein [Bacteroidales bacterium]